jgi:hypothetical protein
VEMTVHNHTNVIYCKISLVLLGFMCLASKWIHLNVRTALLNIRFRSLVKSTLVECSPWPATIVLSGRGCLHNELTANCRYNVSTEVANY